VTIAEEEGERFIWSAHGKSRLEEGGRIKRMIIVSVFTNSKKLSWMNRPIMIIESEFDPATQQFGATAHEWI
jgi:hypothetical protein